MIDDRKDKSLANHIPYALYEFSKSKYFNGCSDLRLDSCELEGHSTSCVLTAVKCAKIIFGSKKVDDILHLLGRDYTSGYVKTLSGGEKLCVSVKKLTLRSVFLDFLKDKGNSNVDPGSVFSSSRLSEAYVELAGRIDQCVADAYIKQSISGGSLNLMTEIKENITKVGVRLNLEAIDALEAECELNLKNVSDDKSFFYWITMTGEKDKKLQTAHSFFISQEYCKENDKVVCRLYQSWIKKATLAEDMQKRDYLNPCAGMNEIEFKTFLAEFRKIFSGIETNYKNCFGYNSSTAALPHFEGATLLGMELHYYSEAINCGEVVERLRKAALQT